MNIAVCIKHVPISNDVSVDPVTHALIRENIEGMINPADLNAIEEAILLKEAHGAKIVVFTMGPGDAEKSLRTALSMGCDDAVLVTDRLFGGADTVATSKVLASAISHYGDFSLILTGAQTSDGATGQVGPMVAAQLDIAHISDAQSINREDSGEGIEAVKKFCDSNVRLRSSFPVLITIAFGCNTPRFPTLRSQLAARKKDLLVYTNKELELSRGSVGMEGSPTVVIDSCEPERAARAEFLQGSVGEITEIILDLIEKEKGNC